MSAYLIVDELSVENPEQLNEYISRAGPLITRAGGELIASGVPEVLEEVGTKTVYHGKVSINGEVKRMVEL